MIVIADTTPLNYLIRIGQVAILRALYEEVCIPVEVLSEMLDPGAPIPVREWAQGLPSWVRVSRDTQTDDPELLKLDPGERAAIALALRTEAGLLLLDERLGRAVAMRKGVTLTGTVGVLRDAANLGMIDFESEVIEIRSLGFRVSEAVLNEVRKSLI